MVLFYKNLILNNKWVLGVDVGGTFTDFCARDEKTGKTFIHKRPSTPDDPSKAILLGLEELCEKIDFSIEKLFRLAHGTTVATNALLQRRGANLVLITTYGFRDMIEIGRQIRPKVYDLQVDAPSPLIPRSNRFEIKERVDANGNQITKISKKSLKNLIKQISLLKNIDGVAICFLFSFLNPVHEKKVAYTIKKKFPKINISISSDVQPEFREFERFSTTVINAFLQPSVSIYMKNLKKNLNHKVKNTKLGIFQSSGGLTSVDRAEKFPVRMALSGPAAGVIGAADVSKKSGFKNIITLDMGGTSTDVCLIQNSEAGISNMQDVAGFSIRLPMLDINTVGAGGGSIAYIGKDNLMKVGPESAGAIPGPACYGLGGDLPTVSDANLVLGRLPENLVGGNMKLDLKKSKDVIKPIAKKLNLSIEKIALGITEIATSNMTRAIRAVSVERGHDPRNFVLMPFGGAGGLHAVDVAKSLSIKKIFIPKTPGILCAQGLIVSDLRESFVSTCRISVFDYEKLISKPLQKLVKKALPWFKKDGSGVGKQKLDLFFDMRYEGQNYELSIFISNIMKSIKTPKKNKLKKMFFDAHKRNYGHYDQNAPIEIVNLRLRASTSLPFVKEKASIKKNKVKPIDFNYVWFDKLKPIKTPLYERKSFYPQFTFNGPAIILQEDATTLVPSDYNVLVDDAENIIMELNL